MADDQSCVGAWSAGHLENSRPAEWGPDTLHPAPPARYPPGGLALPLPYLCAVLHVYFQLVRQDVRYHAYKAARILLYHALERSAAVLLPLGANTEDEQLTRLRLRPTRHVASRKLDTFEPSPVS
jgi:hypothetical protein